MVVLGWILALLLPLVLLFLFSRYIVHQWAIMKDGGIPTELGVEFDLPNFGSSPSDSIPLFLSRKAYIWYTLFLITVLVSVFFPPVGRLLFFLSSAFLFLLIVGQFIGLSLSKASIRNLPEFIGRDYLPVVRMFRASLAYIIILFVVFNLFFNLVILPA